MKWIFSLCLLFISTVLFATANKQTVPAVCLLLQHQMNDYAHVPESLAYQSAKKDYRRLCNPTAVVPDAVTQVIDNKFINSRYDTVNNVPVSNVSSQDISNNSGFSNRPVGKHVIAPDLQSSPLTLVPISAPKPVEMVQSIWHALPSYLVLLVLLPFVFALLLMILALLGCDRAAIRGWIGERRVNAQLAQLCQTGDYTLYKNLLLEVENGQLTEIDHLVVSAFGVFVIESKNYSGWIFGSEKQAKWTQQIYRKKTSFMNPLRQNYKHCLAVHRLLGVLSGVESVVVFNDSAEFKTTMPSNVVHLMSLTTYITNKKANHQAFVFTANQLAVFNQKIQNVVQATTKADYKRHLVQVKQLQKTERCSNF
ncbi:nuclease-related domain-containing protein [Pseudoalteromonas tunicata]|uniref:nuclease-related domain-containing protein n=1 Tax=Pseudoalteromonas tunicata TaxID=314281 RepID=UPI00273E8845|nr:nuclease-related domain-containing protein [Pseudoalteromonas tunicata]MDP5213387.1 nuclease-related domain-containing protein [Pseudoalteromonas tunicata]